MFDMCRMEFLRRANASARFGDSRLLAVGGIEVGHVI